MAQKVWFNIRHDDHIPARYANILERGAIVNGDQVVAAGASLTIHEGFDFASGDKWLYAPSRTVINLETVHTITTITSTSIAVPLGGSFADKSILINLGADTGGTLLDGGTYDLPNWDAAAIEIYEDPFGDSAISNSRVTIETGGEVSYWGSTQPHWVVLVSAGGVPVKVYLDSNSSSGGSVPTYTAVTEPTASAAWLNQMIVVKDTNQPAQVKMCTTDLAGTGYEWVPLGSGQAF
jgi:hypothetical protein